MDQCCNSADCTVGGCYLTTSILSCLGGPPEPVFNECLSDECQVDSDCPNMGAGPEACIQANAYGYPYRSCMPSYCHTDADCTAQPCGVCAPIIGDCCSLPVGLVRLSRRVQASERLPERGRVPARSAGHRDLRRRHPHVPGLT